MKTLGIALLLVLAVPVLLVRALIGLFLEDRGP